MDTNRYKIVKCGTDEVVHGYHDVPRSHAVMLCIEASEKNLTEMEVGEAAMCNFRSSGVTAEYDVVRIA